MARGGGHLDPHRFPIESMMAVILVMPFVASTLVTLGELSLGRGFACTREIGSLVHVKLARLCT